MTTSSGGTAARRAARQAAGGDATRATTDPASDRVAGRRSLDPDRRVALEEERDFLLRSLQDLEREHDAGDVDEADYAALKDDYTARAAAAIRAIDDHVASNRALRAERDWRRTALVLVVVGLIAVGAGWVVFRNAGTRAPGQGLTGDVRQDSANLILQAQGLTGQAQASRQAGDASKALDQFESAIRAYDRALELSPENVQALTYRGWVLHTVALSSEESIRAQLDQQARQYLDEAIATDPTYADARVFRAILERNAGQFAAAKVDLEAIDMRAIPPYMTQMVNAVKEDVAAGRRD